MKSSGCFPCEQSAANVAPPSLTISQQLQYLQTQTHSLSMQGFHCTTNFGEKNNNTVYTGFCWTVKQPHSLSIMGFHCTVEQTHSLSMPGFSQQTHGPQGVLLYCGTTSLFVHAGFTANPWSTRGFTVLWNKPTLCPCREFYSKPQVCKGFHCTVEQTHSLSMQGVSQQTLGLQHVCVCLQCFFIYFCIILYVNSFGRTMLYMCIEYHIQVNMYHVSAQGFDECMINIHYYYYNWFHCTAEQTHSLSMQGVSQQPHGLQGVSLYCETTPFFVHV